MPPTTDHDEPTQELQEALAPSSQAINRPSRWWSAPHSIDVVNAVCEIIAWAEDKREFSSKHKPAWRSVANDYFSARNATTAVAHGRIPAFGMLDSAVQAVLSNLSAAGNGVAIYSVVMNSVRVAAREVLKQLEEPEALCDAFDALLDATRNDAASSEEVSLKRDFFWRLVELQGLSYREISDSLLGILDDEPFYIQRAWFRLGDRNEPPVAKYREEVPAGLSILERIELCRRVLLDTAAEANHAVWLAFQHAHLEAVSMPVGPVIFYIGRFIKGVANSESASSGDSSQLPRELTAERDRFSRNLLEGDDDGDIVYARVDLGTGRYSDSVRVARQIAQSVVTLASFTVSTGNWQLCDGFLQVVNDSLAWTGAFARPRVIAPTAAAADPTPVALKELSGKLTNNLATSIMANGDWGRVLGLLDWRERAKNSDPMSRIVLDVRVIETISGWIGQDHWRQYLDDYHRLSWIRTRIGASIANVGQDATSPWWGINVEHRRQLRAINRRFTEDKGYGQVETDIKVVLMSLDEILALLPSGTRIERDVVTLRFNVSSVDNLRKWCATLSRQWELTLCRAQRIRNALAHGGPVNDAAATSVSQFVRTLSGWSMWVTLEATMASEGLLNAHDSWRRTDELWENSIASSGSVLTGLFPS